MKQYTLQTIAPNTVSAKRYIKRRSKECKIHSVKNLLQISPSYFIFEIELDLNKCDHEKLKTDGNIRFQ